MTERPQYYVAKFLNAGNVAGFLDLASALQTDSDAPFRMFGVAFYVFGAPGAVEGPAGNINFTFRYTRPDGTSFYQRHLVSAQQLNPFDAQAANGAGGQPAPFYSYFSPIHPNVLYPAQTAIAFDFADLPGISTALVLAVFVGTKVYQDGAVWAPTYPATYTARPYLGYALQVMTGDIPLENVPLIVTPDADFVWQSGAQSAYGGGAIAASLFVTLTEIAYFTLTAVTPGTAGNAISFQVTGVGTPGLALAVNVIGTAISVQVATDGAGVSTSTRDQIVTALNADAAVTALVTIAPVGFNGLFVANYGPQNLFGGVGFGLGAGVNTRGIGVRWKDLSGKYYMNDYIPLEMAFGFDNSQRPGLVYPEIYIPKNQQMYFDFNNLDGSALDGTLTLAFKGSKVYPAGS